MTALRTLRTVRHLKLSQMMWRLRYRRLRRREESPRYDLPGNLARKTSGLARDTSFPTGAPAMPPDSVPRTRWKNGRLTVLNLERPFSGGEGWGLRDQGDKHRLWMAQLHGHGWLLDLARRAAAGGREAAAYGADLRRFLLDWMTVCRPGTPGFAAFAWNSYDIATRILNWTRMTPGIPADLEAAMVESMAVQAEYLHDHVEWDLRANHLLRDAAGLACAGRFLRGVPAERWLATATDLATGQVQEQVLPDGGHFERSPMYHLHAMEDLLALSSCLRDATARAAIAEAWKRMAEYAAWLRHPNGKLALFNDGAWNGTASADATISAGLSWKLKGDPSPRRGGRHFANSGMIAWRGEPWTVFFDVGPIGPDYQPGHAHADSLTLEASWGPHQLFVDPGTYAYDDDERRRYDRSTAAHNTVCIDGRDSSEVWQIFRVGRRAYPRDVSAEFQPGGFTARGAHDGYSRLPGKPRHERLVSVANQRELRVVDLVKGHRSHTLSGGWLLAPGWSAKPEAGGWRVSRGSSGVAVTVHGPEGMTLAQEQRTYHPEYGLEVETVRLCWTLRNARLPAEIVTVVA